MPQLSSTSAASILAGMTPTRKEDEGAALDVGGGQHAMESNPFAQSFKSSAADGAAIKANGGGVKPAATKKRKAAGAAPAAVAPVSSSESKRKRGNGKTAGSKKGALATSNVKQPPVSAKATQAKAKGAKSGAVAATQLTALEQKKQRRRERNRLAAASCRQRKVDNEDALRRTLHGAREEHARLVAHEVALKREIAQIKLHAVEQSA